MGRKATIEGRERRLEAVCKSILNLERDLYLEGKIRADELTQFSLDDAIATVEVEVVS